MPGVFASFHERSVFSMKTYTETNGVLYHYCSVESLYNILKSKVLWLTNIRYMNDSKEISWLYELAKQVIQRMAKSLHSENERKLFQMLMDHCDNLFLDETFFPHVHCSCFSKNGDSLGQWRAYASDGKGVAIGFSQSYLKSFVSPQGTRLADVEYRTDKDIADIKTHLEEALASLAKSKYPLHSDQISLCAIEAQTKWVKLAPFCKNAGFREEEEVRLVHTAGPTGGSKPESRIGPLEHFQRRDVIVPYKTLPLDAAEMPITKIVFGPRNRLEHNRTGIYGLAREAGYVLALDQFEVSTASYGELRRTASFRSQR